MSTASRSHPRRLAAMRGFTFIELMVALVIFTSLGLIVERTIGVAQKTERYLNAVNRCTRRGQKVAYEVFDVVSSSRKLFQNDAVGRAYLDAVDTSTWPIAADARLPIFVESGILSPDDAGEPRTGNILLFVRESDPAPCVANATEGTVRYVDTYRFVCVYPHQTTRTIITGHPQAVDLHVWRSQDFPSFPQVMAIEDLDDRRSVIRDLADRFGYVALWDPNGLVDDSFYPIDALGNMASMPATDFDIAPDVDLTEGGRLVYANLQLARTDATSELRRGVLAQDDPTEWVPDGFEVKVVGASGSRKVWLHLVVESQSGSGHVAVHRSSLIASMRDL